MKKILLISLAVVAAVILIVVMVVKQQAGYTKVLTATVVRQDLSTVISGTGQIKPKSYVSATAPAKTASTGTGARSTNNITIGIRTTAVAMRFSILAD